MKKISKFFLAIFVFSYSATAFSATECTTKISRIWNGDEGNNWLILENGMAAALNVADVDTKNITTAATAALLAGKTVTIRFTADGVPCGPAGGTRYDVVGLFLNQN